MAFVTVTVFLLSYVITCTVLFFASSKLNLKIWFSQNRMRKVIAVIISVIIYTIILVLMDKLNISGNYNAMAKGFLLSTIVITVINIMPNTSKNRKINS